MARSSFSESDARDLTGLSTAEIAVPHSAPLLVSRERASTATSAQSLEWERPRMAPPTWPGVLASLLHNISMGAAMMVWLEVCRAVIYRNGESPEDGNSAPQTYYGRLLAVNGACELITSQLVGVLSDKFGRRPIQILAQVGQVIDYGIAGLCLPSLGLVSKIPAETAENLLFASRGIAGFLGNYKVTLQSYTSDISSAEECPTNLAALGGAMVAGMCLGSMLVAIVSTLGLSYRACYFTSAAMNFGIIVLVITTWRDIAPRKDFSFREANPLVALKVLVTSSAMVIYSVLVFLSSFALNMYVSTLDFYCSRFLQMEKRLFIALGLCWAIESLVILAVLQPILTRSIGEITTLTLSFTSLCIFYLLFCTLGPSTWPWAFVIIIFFSFGSMCYPLAVGLATRELPLDQQGALQGAMSILETTAKIFAPLLASDVLIPMYEKPGEFHGMVYLVASSLMVPGICCSHMLRRYTCRIDPNNEITVEMQ